jgi:eukaryotic-like serine/threonine-protein kinase
MTISTHIGKYEIQGTLGEGGMGVVYKAFDPAIRRTVAIKTVIKARLEPSASRSALERFRNEAQAAGRLLHPGIVAVYDYGEDNDVAFIVMEYVRGKSLHEHLSNETQYDLSEAWQILGQLLDAVGYSHAHGVVHRDLKPANILINDDGRIKISDFGIARMDSNHLTEHGEVVGTLYYMAPEQVRGDRVDHRADLYSVGIICYQLLTGRRPFAGTPMEVMNQVLDFMPVDPSRLNPDLPRDLDRIVRKALAKHVEDRFQSARELAERLRQTLDPALVHPAPAAPARSPSPAGPSPLPRPRSGLLEAARRISLVQVPRDSVPDIDLAAVEPQAPTAPSKPRVIFVDDEERILNALRSLFRADYDVVTATEGEQALEALKTGEFDVVVSDQRMPKMLGVEVLRRVRELSPDTVRILLTGYSDLASIVGSINEGEIYRFVSKPWDNQELARILNESVAVSRAVREMRHAPVPSLAVDGTLLVVESEPDLIRAVRELFGRRHRVLYAPSGEEALDLMLNEDVSVLLADVDGNQTQMTTMLKLLKQEQPQVLAIVATGASDSELVIELVNQAQIFRFMNKPLNPTLLKQHIESAMARHRTLRQTPALARQQKVEPPAPAVRESDFGRSILGKLRLLRRRVVGA